MCEVGKKLEHINNKVCKEDEQNILTEQVEYNGNEMKTDLKQESNRIDGFDMFSEISNMVNLI